MNTLKIIAGWFENVGATIKALALLGAVVESLAAFVTGIVLMTDGLEPIYGYLIMFGGPITAWVVSLFPYAFGELVEDVHAIRNKEGTTTEVNAKREAEIKAKYEAEKKIRREAEERAKRKAEEREEQKELKILPRGDGYICPLCSFSNSSFSSCAQCGHNPFENSSEETNNPDDEYVDVACPKCGEMLSFLKNEVQGICLECGAEFEIK